uniref:Uncharacterized protein AlNc14C3G517 n=1 Tax=Albugo laibachii Nc14 TaxID=890382 RepID=F0W049_9STRA|nr:conserved hypothetical protein [Albugo laibachii Nc14]|eukprot:CCA14420.1 conserved hypothetical protein [Albugo laibachii Nc14]
MAHPQAQFISSQLKTQIQLSHRAEAAHTPPSKRSFNGSSAFTDFIRECHRRMRRGLLDEPMQNALPITPRMPPPPQTPKASQYFVPADDHGSKIPKPRDLDWPGFAKFTGKETYPGVRADFKAWVMRFLQRLGPAQLMSGGDWPEEFKVLALSGKRGGAALIYYEKMLPNVLEYLCKSAPAHIQTAILTRLNAQRPDYLVQAAELIAFAIDFEISIKKSKSGVGNGQDGKSGRRQGGRYPGGGRSEKGGRGGKFVARVGSTESRTCYGCGETGNIKSNCPKQRSETKSASSRVVLAIGTDTKADSNSWILDSGSSVHLVRDASMLKHAVNCDQVCRAANNTMVRVTKVGPVELKTAVNGREFIVDLSEVYYANNLADNIISYGKLEEQGVFLERDDNHSYVVHQSDKMKIFEVFRRNNVF